MLFDNPLWVQTTETKRYRDLLLHEVTYGWLVLTMQHAFVLRNNDFDDWPRRFWQPVGLFSSTPFLRSIVDECSMATRLRSSLFYKLGLDITIFWFCSPINIQFISVTAEFTFCSYCFTDWSFRCRHFGSKFFMGARVFKFEECVLSYAVKRLKRQSDKEPTKSFM